MAEYIKLEDAKKVVRLRLFEENYSERQVDIFINDISKIQVDDVVEVVRCAECKHLVPYDGIVGTGVYECDRLKTKRAGMFPPMGFYCAYGERAENGSNGPDEYPVCFNMI